MLALITWWSQRLGGWPRQEDVEPSTWSMAEVGRTRSAQDVLDTLAWFDTASRHVAGWNAHADLLLTPTTTRSAPLLGKSRVGWTADEVLIDLERTTRFTNPFNLTGQPAMSVPAGVTATGLPIGVQLIGAHGRDLDVLRVSDELERAGYTAGAPVIALPEPEGDAS